MTTVFCYTSKPTEFMRESASPQAKVVSETLYLEEVVIVETGKKKSAKWIKIQTVVDGYVGWVPKASIRSCKTSYLSDNSVIVKTNQMRTHIYHIMDTEFGPIMSLPFGVKLKVLSQPIDSNHRWIEVELLNGTKAFIQRGDITLEFKKKSMSEIVEFSKRFLSLPYTWGGRSSFGFDCSGFCQMLYREMYIPIPRDAKDQMKWSGFAPIPLDEIRAGNLIFFGMAEDTIRHVGMSIGGKSFIHTSSRELKPYLRISSLDDPEWNGSGHFSFRAARRYTFADEKAS